MSSTLIPPQTMTAQTAAQIATAHQRHPEHLPPDHRVDRRRGRRPRHHLARLALGREPDRQRHQERDEPDDREEHQRGDDGHASSSSTSVPAKSFGCRKSTGLPCAPGPRRPVAEHPRPLRLQPVARREDVVDLVAEVMDPAARVLREEGRDRRGLPQRMQELDLGVRQLDEDHGHPVLRLVLRRPDPRAQRVAILRRRGGEVRHGDGDMVEPSDHAASTRPHSAAPGKRGRTAASRHEDCLASERPSAPNWRQQGPHGFGAQPARAGPTSREDAHAEGFDDRERSRRCPARSRAGRSLVEFLREGLRLTGTHVGCDTGQCGACVVHVDGVSVKSCNVFALDLEGAEVRTIEGMANPDGSLGVIQAAFQTHHGLQCGFCTPGMVMTRGGAPRGEPRAQRGRDPRVSRGQHLPLHRLPQHRQGDPGRRRRAGARPGRGRVGEGRTCPRTTASAHRVKRREDVRFLTGKGRYTDDLNRPGQAYVHFLRSDVAHGRITRLDTAAAAAMPGVLRGLHRAPTSPPPAACPAAGRSPTASASRCRSRSTRSSPRARCATSASRSPPSSPRRCAQARDAAEAIELEIEELPAVVDMRAALEPGRAEGARRA